MGAVADVVKRYVPASYRAMVGITNSYYGASELQALANYVQFRLYATTPGSAQEAAVWDPKETELLGMLTTLQFIPAAIDFWGDQLSSESTTGTNENVSYFDRRPDLWRVYARIAEDALILGTEMDLPVYAIKAVVPQVSYGDNGRGILITADPMDTNPEFARKRNTDPIPWSQPS